MTTTQLTTYAIPYRRPVVTTGHGDEAQHVFPELVQMTLCDPHKRWLDNYMGESGWAKVHVYYAGESCDVCDSLVSRGGIFAIVIERVLGL